MKILHIDTKDKYINLIEEGRKVTEVQEIRPRTRMLFVKNRNNEFLKDNNGVSVPKHYDAIMFHSEHQQLLVEVKASHIVPILNSQGFPVEYEYKKERLKAEKILFELGRIYKSDVSLLRVYKG